MDRFTVRSGVPFLCILGLISLFGSPVFAQSAGYADNALEFAQRYPGVDARLQGMGGVGIAGVGDVGAFLANPAGLGYIARSQFSGVLTGVSVRDKARFQVGSGEPRVTSARFGETTPSSLNLLYKVPTTQGSFVMGAGYNQLYNFTRFAEFSGRNEVNSLTDDLIPFPSDYDIIELGSGDPPDLLKGQFYDTPNDPEYIIDFDPDGNGQINRPLSYLGFLTYGIDFDSFCYENPDASACGSVPFLPAVAQNSTVRQHGNITVEGGMSEFSLGGAVEGAEDVMAGIDFNIVTGTQRLDRIFAEADFRNQNDGSGGTVNFDSLRYTFHLETELVGLNARGGISTTPIPNLRLGLVLESPTLYSASESYSEQLTTWFDDGFTETGGGERADPGTGSFDYRITTPWRIGAGVSYQVAGLLVEANAEMIDWAQMQLSADGGGSVFRDINRQIRSDFGMVFPYRFGAEYVLGNLAVRAGYALHPDPRMERDDRTYYTAGLGYRLGEKFFLEGSWMLERTEDTYRPYPTLPDSPVIRQDIARNVVSIGARILF